MRATERPRLEGLLPRFPAWRKLGAGPTPVRELPGFAAAQGLGEVWLKDDGQSSSLYGGNKVRKLEFLLARSLERGRGRILTVGALGSHHCVATSAFGRELGLEVDLYLYPQPLNPHVLENLRLDHAFGARMHRVAHVSLAPLQAGLGALRRGAHRGAQEIIPPGGSDPLGNLGYVEGALELAAQIEAGELPKPDAIYLAAGTCGTAAGLAVGLRLAGLGDIAVRAVQVVETIVCNPLTLRSLARLTARRLRRYGSRIADECPPALSLERSQLGAGYGHPTEASKVALAALEDSEGIRLDPTYTSKALAGLLSVLKQPGRRRERSLFWNTVSGVDLTARAAQVRPADLPAAFHEDFRALNAFGDASAPGPAGGSR